MCVYIKGRITFLCDPHFHLTLDKTIQASLFDIGLQHKGQHLNLAGLCCDPVTPTAEGNKTSHVNKGPFVGGGTARRKQQETDMTKQDFYYDSIHRS